MSEVRWSEAAGVELFPGRCEGVRPPRSRGLWSSSAPFDLHALGSDRARQGAVRRQRVLDHRRGRQDHQSGHLRRVRDERVLRPDVGTVRRLGEPHDPEDDCVYVQRLATPCRRPTNGRQAVGEARAAVRRGRPAGRGRLNGPQHRFVSDRPAAGTTLQTADESVSGRRPARCARRSTYTDSSRPRPRRPAQTEVRRGEREQHDRGPHVEPQAEHVVDLDGVDAQHLDPAAAERCRPSRRARTRGRGRAGAGGRARRPRRSASRHQSELVEERRVERSRSPRSRRAGASGSISSAHGRSVGLAEQLLVEPVAPAPDRVGDQHARGERVEHRQQPDAAQPAADAARPRRARSRPRCRGRPARCTAPRPGCRPRRSRGAVSVMTW